MLKPEERSICPTAISWCIASSLHSARTRNRFSTDGQTAYQHPIVRQLDLLDVEDEQTFPLAHRVREPHAR